MKYSQKSLELCTLPAKEFNLLNNPVPKKRKLTPETKSFTEQDIKRPK